MVRTYNFNPSMQSSVNLTGLPKVNFNSYTMMPKTPIRQDVQYQKSPEILKVKPMQQASPNFIKVQRPCPLDQPGYYRSLESLHGDYSRQNSSYKFDDKNMGLSSKNASKSTNNLTKLDLPSNSFDNNTTLLGVQSITVNGQKYYRPLDPESNRVLNEQFNVLKGGPTGRYGDNFNDFDAAFKALAMAVEENRRSAKQDQHGQYNNGNGNKAVHNEPINNLNDQKVGLKLNLPQSWQQQNKYPSDEISSRDSGILMENDLPWARGNPQPRNGKRGTAGWNQFQRMSPYNSFGNSYKDDFQMQMSAPPQPIDSNFNQTNRSLGATILSDPFVTKPNYYDPIEDSKRWEKEQHRLDLLRQIQENEQRKRIEKQKEWEEDERERLRAERTLQRQRAEIDREQEEVKHRQAMAELKAQRVALEAETQRLQRRQRSPIPDTRSRNMQRGIENNNNGSGTPPPRLEWWERNKTWQDRQKEAQSPVIPALRGNNNNYAAENDGTDSRVRSRTIQDSIGSSDGTGLSGTTSKSGRNRRPDSENHGLADGTSHSNSRSNRTSHNGTDVTSGETTDSNGYSSTQNTVSRRSNSLAENNLRRREYRTQSSTESSVLPESPVRNGRTEIFQNVQARSGTGSHSATVGRLRTGRSRISQANSIDSYTSNRSTSTEAYLTSHSASRMGERRPQLQRSTSRTSRHSYTPSVASRHSSLSQTSAMKALESTQKRLDEELRAMRNGQFAQ
ncbi:unnamed protein product [Bursaphelenchus okinawaensis]|uniref:CCDC66 domain-containing protein n=1 Tax=Bursaphelenchus okinawaensis TaxID=465554 RepID=A0A811KD06_9BILA|nr:unnamed protein product [Bursaphelenchus okinawaensis]CAG9101258.1 unnamed protein product [Bursaphelenchus okinawaensis]